MNSESVILSDTDASSNHHSFQVPCKKRYFSDIVYKIYYGAGEQRINTELAQRPMLFACKSRPYSKITTCNFPRNPYHGHSEKENIKGRKGDWKPLAATVLPETGSFSTIYK